MWWREQQQQQQHEQQQIVRGQWSGEETEKGVEVGGGRGKGFDVI